MQTVFGARLAQHASNALAVPAIMLPDRELSYRELLGRVAACANWLTWRGCAPAEVIAITIAQEVQHLVASLALLSLGVPQVCLPTHEPTRKRLDLSERLGVSRVIVSDSTHALPGLETLLLEQAPLEHRADSAVPDAIDADPDRPAIYYTSSGTTGEPKIFAWSQRAVAWRAERMAEAERIGPRARSLTPASIEHSLAKSKRLTCAYLGVTSVFPDDPSAPSPLPELCARLEVTNLELSTLQVLSLIGDARAHCALPTDTTVFSAGSPVRSMLRRRFRDRFGMPLFVNYGAREFGRIATSFPDGVDDDVESVGRPVPWIDLQIVDRDGAVLPRGEIGEVRVRSECMVREYHRDPVMTSRHFRGGWFYPHDIGSLTPRGELCLHGRIDEMMNLHGIKCFPAEIERVLEAHPAVKAAAAFPSASSTHGDIPIAAVELHESSRVGEDELLARAREFLGVRAPRKIIVLEMLPRNAAGKIVKRELKGLLAGSR